MIFTIINFLTSLPNLFSIVERIGKWIRSAQVAKRKYNKDEAVKLEIEKYTKGDK